jgi:hypothetical protein
MKMTAYCRRITLRETGQLLIRDVRKIQPGRWKGLRSGQRALALRLPLEDTIDGALDQRTCRSNRGLGHARPSPEGDELPSSLEAAPWALSALPPQDRSARCRIG